MTHQAHGTFTVNIQPLPSSPAEGISRHSIEKQIHGDLEATSVGEMLAGGDPKRGAAGYVAMEIVTGTLAGRSGSFAMQHFATMDANGPNLQIPNLQIVVVPGSSTGELKGIAGTFNLRIESGRHFYDFDYTLPE